MQSSATEIRRAMYRNVFWNSILATVAYTKCEHKLWDTCTLRILISEKNSRGLIYM